MNRKITFRAWDKVNKKMIYSPMAICSGAGGWVMFTAEIEGLDCGHAIHPIQQYELMEYIGRLDHHDIEMCEGDIIESIDNTSKGLVKSVVTITDIRHLPDFTCSKWQEIIGNLYENPELMEAARALGLVEEWQQ